MRNKYSTFYACQGNCYLKELSASLNLVLIQYKFIGLKMYKQIDSKESWVKLKVAVLKLLA